MRMSKNKLNIIDLLQREPNVSTGVLEERLGMLRSPLNRLLKQMTEQGLIRRESEIVSEGLDGVSRRYVYSLPDQTNRLASQQVSEGMADHVYLLQCEGYYKIGIAHNVAKRVASMTTGNPFPIHVVLSDIVPNAHKYEQSLHEMFKHKRIRGEWFQLTPDDVAAVRTIITSVTESLTLL